VRSKILLYSSIVLNILLAGLILSAFVTEYFDFILFKKSSETICKYVNTRQESKSQNEESKALQNYCKYINTP
jgi:hypothetical protein